MTDTFKYQASARATPDVGLPLGSGCPTIEVPFDEDVILAFKHYTEPNLTADAPVAVDFGSVTNAAVVVVAVEDGKKVRVRLTSADGTDQAVPVDDSFVLLCRSVPVTAIDLTRVVGVDTRVKVFLGEATS